MPTLLIIIIITIIAGVLSMIGGVVLLGKPKLVKKFSLHFLSFAAGTLLATAFLDLLPEAADIGKIKTAFITALAGIVAFFILELLIYRLHSHSYEDVEGVKDPHSHATPTLILIGDAVHNFIDGVIISSSFLISPGLGITTAIAVGAHELPQEISDYSIMLAHGWSRKKVWWANFGVSLTAILGAVITYFSKSFIEPALGGILGLTAGIFVYIAAVDLIPEITVLRRDKPSHVLLMMTLGIAIILAATRLLE